MACKSTAVGCRYGFILSVVRYWSGGPGIDSPWCHRGFFSVVPPTEPCALRSTQPLKVSTRDFSWGKGGRCVWLTIYHPCSAETSRKSGALTYPEPLGPPRPVAGHLYFLLYSATGVRVLGYGVRFLAGVNDFSFLQNVQTGSWPHPAYWFSGVKVSPPFSVAIKNSCSCNFSLYKPS